MEEIQLSERMIRILSSKRNAASVTSEKLYSSITEKELFWK